MAEEITYRTFKGEEEIEEIIALIDGELSEPYGIYTYRYFMDVCPEHTILAHAGEKLVGVIVGRTSPRKELPGLKGYIAMLVVVKEYRRAGIGKKLAVDLINKFKEDCQEVTLETEITNTAALHLYESLGFTRTKRLYRYYLNGNEAYKLKIWF